MDAPRIAPADWVSHKSYSQPFWIDTAQASVFLSSHPIRTIEQSCNRWRETAGDMLKSDVKYRFVIDMASLKSE